MSGFVNVFRNVIFLNPFVVNLLISFIYLIVGYLMIRIVMKIIKSVLESDNLNKLFKEIGVKKNTKEIFLSAVKWYLYFILSLIILEQIGVQETIIQAIFIILVIMVLLAVGLSLKNIIPNTAAGFYIISSNTLKKGDKVKIKDCEGVVHKITLISVYLKKNQTETIIIPNSLLLKEIIKKKK